jgi:hypothetical protein
LSFNIRVFAFFSTEMYDAPCCVLLHLQALFGSTSQIDKSYIYTFLWPWLGSGLLTSTGKMIHLHSANVRNVIQPQSDNVSKATETLLDTVSKVTETHSSTVSKMIEPYCETVI